MANMRNTGKVRDDIKVLRRSVICMLGCPTLFLSNNVVTVECRGDPSNDLLRLRKQYPDSIGPHTMFIYIFGSCGVLVGYMLYVLKSKARFFFTSQHGARGSLVLNLSSSLGQPVAQLWLWSCAEARVELPPVPG